MLGLHGLGLVLVLSVFIDMWMVDETTNAYLLPVVDKLLMGQQKTQC